MLIDKYKQVIGFDYGTKYIGVAIGQLITKTATPISILKARAGVPDWNDVEILLDEWKPAIVVVGIPYNMDGTESEMSMRAKKFGNRIKGRFALPFYECDERLTSFEIKQIKKEQHLSIKRQSNLIDSNAAKLILESWMRNINI